MSNDTTRDWIDEDKKTDAVYKVLRYLAKNSPEGAASVGNDAKAQELFERVGEIKVPAGQRVIIFASGEKGLKHRGSVILEIPSGIGAQTDNKQLRQFVLGNYPYWPKAQE